MGHRYPLDFAISFDIPYEFAVIPPDIAWDFPVSVREGFRSSTEEIVHAQSISFPYTHSKDLPWDVWNFQRISKGHRIYFSRTSFFNRRHRLREQHFISIYTFERFTLGCLEFPADIEGPSRLLQQDFVLPQIAKLK